MCRAFFNVKQQFGCSAGSIAAGVHRCGSGVAGHARNGHHVPKRAIDARDNAQRHVVRVQYRALLNVYLDKPKVLRSVPRDAFYSIDVQSRVRHGGLHRDALRILLRQPFGLEVARQRAGP